GALRRGGRHGERGDDEQRLHGAPRGGADAARRGRRPPRHHARRGRARRAPRRDRDPRVAAARARPRRCRRDLSHRIGHRGHAGRAARSPARRSGHAGRRHARGAVAVRARRRARPRAGGRVRAAGGEAIAPPARLLRRRPACYARPTMTRGRQALTIKPIDVLLAEMAGEHRLRRALGPVTLTALGIGCIIGAGIFVLTGLAANQYAGPALVLSFVVAGLGCAFAALCYAEFASMVPVAGSAYTYAYATLGELFAWIIGWDLVLEYAVAASAVAHGWSHYF